jgi:hypothetical protein
MSTRLKVYGFLILLAALAGGGYLAKQKYFNGDTAQANSDAAAKKSEEDQTVPVGQRRT